MTLAETLGGVDATTRGDGSIHVLDRPAEGGGKSESSNGEPCMADRELVMRMLLTEQCSDGGERRGGSS